MDKELEKTWDLCVKCGICRSVCPVFKEEKSEAFVARGHITLLSEFIKGNVDFSSSLSKDYLYECLLCTTCTEACPNGVQTDTVVEIARHAIIKRHGLPLYKRIMAKVLKNRRLMDFLASGAYIFSFLIFKKDTDTSRNSFSLRHNIPTLDTERLIPAISKISFINKYKSKNRSVKLAIFPGCLINYTYTSIGDAFVDILHKLNVDFIVPNNQMCCGAPLYFSGDFEDALYLVKKNIELFEALDVEDIIVLEPTCASVMKFDYIKLAMYFEDKELKERAAKLADKIIDPVKWLYDKTNILELLGTLNIKTTYHDPCHLKRAQKIKDEPRVFIKSISNFTEMKDSDRCCGNGGTFSIDYRDISKNIVNHKVKNITNLNPDYLISGCSACIMQLSEALSFSSHGNIKTIHTLELMNMALKEADNEKT